LARRWRFACERGSDHDRLARRLRAAVDGRELGDDALQRLRLSEEVPLAVVDAELAQQRNGRLVVDVLCEGLLAESAGDGNR
jgi:hypothetical protein